MVLTGVSTTEHTAHTLPILPPIFGMESVGWGVGGGALGSHSHQMWAVTERAQHSRASGDLGACGGGGTGQTCLTSSWCSKAGGQKWTENEFQKYWKCSRISRSNSDLRTFYEFVFTVNKFIQRNLDRIKINC